MVSPLLSQTTHITSQFIRQYSSDSGGNNDDPGELSGAYWEQQYQHRFGQPVASPLQSLLSNTGATSNKTSAATDSSNYDDKGAQLTHTDSSGKANMVDVSAKTPTVRMSKAKATMYLGKKAYELVKSNQSQKGDVLAVARIAGIIGAKKTSDLIPLCHNIPISKVSIEFAMNDDDFSVDIFSEARTVGVTGIEMESLTAASVAALTVYDMCKAVTHGIVITDVKFLHKSGGKSLYNSK